MTVPVSSFSLESRRLAIPTHSGMPTLDAARPNRLAHLAPETVALGADGYATGEGALHLQPRVVTHP